jgi:ferric-dicitrate binding protein FerR (iron transport regulator)
MRHTDGMTREQLDRRTGSPMRRGTGFLTALAIVAALAVPAYGQVPIATLASLAGTVEVQRGGKGEWQAAALGSPVFAEDVVRTGPGAFTKLVFVDEVVVDLGPSSALAVERSGAAKRPRRSLLRLAQGALEAWIGADGESGRYEVETPTAVVRPQSTDFIVRYDPAEKATDVVGVAGTVTVQGTTGIIGPGVAVGPNETTRVPLDGFPSPARALEPAQAGTYVQGLRRIGTGGRDGLDTDNPIVDGRVVNPNDRPSATAATTVSAGPFLKPGVPGQTLIDSLSPDIRANNQPLPVYRAVPPNQSPVPPR